MWLGAPSPPLPSPPCLRIGRDTRFPAHKHTHSPTRTLQTYTLPPPPSPRDDDDGDGASASSSATASASSSAASATSAPGVPHIGPRGLSAVGGSHNHSHSGGSGGGGGGGIDTISRVDFLNELKSKVAPRGARDDDL